MLNFKDYLFVFSRILCVFAVKVLIREYIHCQRMFH